METIWKYEIYPQVFTEIAVNEHAEILSVKVQKERVFVWIRVDDLEPQTFRKRILCVGTGHPISRSAERLRFIDTVLMNDDTMVFHFFEVI